MKNLLKASFLSLFSFTLTGTCFAITSLSALTEEAQLQTRSGVVTFGYVMQVFFSLLIVFGLIYLTAKYILPKFQVKGQGRLIEIADRIGLEPQVTAYILKVRKTNEGI